MYLIFLSLNPHPRPRRPLNELYNVAWRVQRIRSQAGHARPMSAEFVLRPSELLG